MQRNTLWAAALTIGLVVASAVSAHESRRPPKERACAHDCFEATRTCVNAAQTDFRMCRETTCADEIAAVRAACATDRNSDACREAHAALSACAAPCHETYRPALQACGAANRQCLADCPDRRPTPAPKDPECVSACRAGLSGCLDPARMTLETCRDGCSALATAARQACGNRPAEACRQARQALDQCLRPCNRVFAAAQRTCLDAAHECVRMCPEHDAE